MEHQCSAEAGLRPKKTTPISHQQQDHCVLDNGALGNAWTFASVPLTYVKVRIGILHETPSISPEPCKCTCHAAGRNSAEIMLNFLPQCVFTFIASIFLFFFPFFKIKLCSELSILDK